MLYDLYLLQTDMKQIQTPIRIWNAAQYLRMTTLMEDLANYRMDPKDDIIQHVINVNKKIQEIIWKGGLRIRNDLIKYRMLKDTLITDADKDLLFDVWFSDMDQKYSTLITDFVKAYIRRGAKRTAIFATNSSTRKRNHKIIGTPWMPNLDIELPKDFMKSFPVLRRVINSAD